MGRKKKRKHAKETNLALASIINEISKSNNNLKLWGRNCCLHWRFQIASTSAESIHFAQDKILLYHYLMGKKDETIKC